MVYFVKHTDINIPVIRYRRMMLFLKKDILRKMSIMWVILVAVLNFSNTRVLQGVTLVIM